MTRWTRGMAVVVAAVALTGGSRAFPSEDVHLQTQAGFDGQLPPGAWVPVSVTVEPQRLFVGEVRVAAATNTGRLVVERAVEVSGGSRKVFRFALPPTSRVTVEAVGDGGVRTRRDVPVRAVPATAMLVGVLGRVPDDVPDLESRGSGLRVIYVPVDAAWIPTAPRVLEGLGTLVASLSDLQALTEAGRRALGAAVAGGLDVTVVIDRPGRVAPTGLPAWPVRSAETVTLAGGEALQVLDAAPDAWRLDLHDLPGRTGPRHVLAAATAIGRGRVAAVGVPLGAPGLGQDPALWSHLLTPGAALVTRSQAREAEDSLEVSHEVLQGSGLAAPSLPWLAGFLVAYVVVVGPVNGLMLSRLRRRELAWATVPAITVLFSGGAFGAAAVSKPPIGVSAHAAYWLGGSGTDVAVVAVRAPRPGDHVLRLAGEWEVLPAATRRATEVRRDGTGTAASLQLDALEVGALVGFRPTSRPPPLAVGAVATAGAVRVTVRNQSPATVREITVRAAAASSPIGELVPGQTRTVEVGGPQLVTAEPWGDPVQRWRGPRGVPELPGAAEALLRRDVLDRAPGLVWAVGTVGRAAGAVTANGRRTRDTGTLVAVAAEPTVAGGTVSPYAIRRDVVALTRVGDGPPHWSRTGTAIEAADAVVARFRLPATGAPLAALRSQLERSHPIGRPGPGVTMECRPGAPCEEEQHVAVPVPPLCPPGVPCGEPKLEVLSAATGTWLPLGKAFARGRGEPNRLVGPLGDVHVRLTAGGGLIDLSGRGLVAEVTR